MKTGSHLLMVLALSSFLYLGCPKDKPPSIIIPPEPTNCEYPAGNRNFTWRLDTVAWWPSTLGGVWAFSDSDAYVMGNMHGPTVPGQTSYLGLHWNGKAWGENISYNDVLHLSNDATGDNHFMVSVGYWAVGDEKVGLAEFDNQIKKWKGYQFQTQGELRSVWTDRKGCFIAVGDNGMVYTKDGYTTEWNYSKAPTDFNFIKVDGISKTEIYVLGEKSLATGGDYAQVWEYSNNAWIKLMDNQDTTNTPIRIPESGDRVYGVAASRCSITDSLYLFISGGESFEFTTKGSSLVFTKVNLSSKGLPLSGLRLPAGDISLFSPNDFWIGSLQYYFYHWNGTDFQKMEPIPTLPYGQLWGGFSKARKSPSGKTWIILEMNSQVYAVLQGNL